MDNCSAEEHLGLQNGKRKIQHGFSAILVQIPIQILTILANKPTSVAYVSERKTINRQPLNIFYASFLTPHFMVFLAAALKMNAFYGKHGGYLVALELKATP